MRTLAIVGLGVCACIIPDRDIRIDPGIDNESAVRIIQRAPQYLPEMDDLCNAEKDPDYTFCPEVRYTEPSGLLRPVVGGPFCICPGPKDQKVRDQRALSAFEIYAEDGDLEGDRAEDTLYGVLLLDVDPRTSAPQAYQAYPNFWQPCFPGERLPVSADNEGDRTAPPVGRQSNSVTVFKLDEESTGVLDLCNNNNGSSLSPGLHDLQFMVTDRPFFTPPDFADPTQSSGQPQCGVPDLRAGATYAVIDYVFECVDSALDPIDCVQERPPGDATSPICRCDCAEPEGGP